MKQNKVYQPSKTDGKLVSSIDGFIFIFETKSNKITRVGQASCFSRLVTNTSHKEFALETILAILSMLELIRY